MKTKRHYTRLTHVTLALASLLILSACASSGSRGPAPRKLTASNTVPDRYFEPRSEEWKFED